MRTDFFFPIYSADINSGLPRARLGNTGMNKSNSLCPRGAYSLAEESDITKFSFKKYCISPFPVPF